MFKKYVFYLIRWQLSTPILAVVLIWLDELPTLAATVVANLIGGLIFFWVDKFIFKTNVSEPLWEIRDDAVCVDCGHQGRGYRIAEWFHYHRINEKTPDFRCEHCKDRKMLQVRAKIRKRG